MDFIKKLRLFKPKTKDWKLDDGHRVDKAFVDGGIQHYMIKDTFDTFSHRALSALSVYEKWNMKCNREYLDLFTKTIDKLLSDPAQINVGEIYIANKNLKERLQWALPTEDVIYEFASVVFFDNTESPYKYDPDYAKVKIARWKKNNSIEDFFLSIPIKDLIPCPNISKQDLQTYFQIVKTLDKKHLKQITDVLSSSLPNNNTPLAKSFQGTLQQT